MKLITLPFAGGCSARRLFGRADDPAAPAPPAAPATVTVTTTPAPAPLSAPDASGPCTDDDLVVAFVHACRLSRGRPRHSGRRCAHPRASTPRQRCAPPHAQPRRRRHRRRHSVWDRHLEGRRVRTLGQLGRYSAQRIRLAPNERRRTDLQRKRQPGGPNSDNSRVSSSQSHTDLV